jgi:integrase/recombinase XerD
METKDQIQGIVPKLDLDVYLSRLVELFIMDRRSSGAAAGTIKFYSQKLQHFVDFCDGQLVKSITGIDANLLRLYMISLEEKGHNKGGLHAHYRAMRTFLLWYEAELDPAGWINPIKKLKAPRLPQEILPPVSIETVKALLKTCDKDTIFGMRDYAIILLLFDTGLRASEVLSLNRNDTDPTGAIFVHHGKGNKDRFAYIGKKSRLMVKKYLRLRTDEHPALFLSRLQERLTYDGLREIISRRAKAAGIKEPSLHSFRRAFALNMLRSGIDIHTLAKLMGHSGVVILAKYLKIDDTDTRAAHRKGNPVDDNL